MGSTTRAALPNPDQLFTYSEVMSLPAAQRIAWGEMIVNYQAVKVQQQDFNVRIAGYLAIALAALFGIHVVRDILK